MTMSSRKPIDNRSDEMEQLVHEYLRHCGKLIPQTPDEVAAAEEWLNKQDTQVPKGLQSLDGCSVASKLVARRMTSFPIQATEAGKCLARAARDGRSISPEIEAQMKRDREQKEREAKGDK